MTNHPQIGKSGPQEVKNPAAYDVCTPGALPADQIGFVEAIHQRFVRSLAREFGDYLETPVAAELAGIEQMEFSAFTDSGSGDACVISLDAAGGHGRAFLALSSGFVFRVLGLLIGAPADTGAETRQSITGIEHHILREGFDLIVRNLRDAWAHHKVNFRPVSPETGAENAPAATHGNAVVVTCAVRFGDAEELIRVAFPALLVRLAVLEAGNAVAPSPAEIRPGLLQAMRGAAVQVEAVLGGASLRMGDLLAMEPGQILMLGLPAECSFECLINGKARFSGELIANGDRQAFQVDAPLEPPPNQRPAPA